MSNSAFWLERLEKTKTLLEAIDDALLQFATSGAALSVSIDTGQTRTSYTKADLTKLEGMRDRLLNEVSVLEIRTGQRRAGLYARPGW